MQNRSQGFTLMELMVALAIAAIILGIAAPGFNEFRRNNRLTAAANDFLAATQVARTEAIKRQVPVSVCPSNNPRDAAATCSGGPFTGWIVFEDTNNNCLRAGVTETIVKADGPVADTLTVSSNGRCVSFAATGFLQPAAVTGQPTASRTVYCDDRGTAAVGGTNQSAARGIFVTNTGRSRVTRDITSGSATDISTWGDARCQP